jgi:hypothetical protein
MLAESHPGTQRHDPGQHMTANASDESPSGTLRQSLLDDLKPHPEGGPPQARYLYAIVDMGRLPDARREETYRRLEALDVFPLLVDPAYEILKPHAAHRVAHRRADAAQNLTLLKELIDCTSDTVSAWIVCKLPPAHMARHLSQGSFAHDKNSKRYLLRYYDPLVTPILYRLAKVQWTRWFFGPMVSWWYPLTTPDGDTWRRLGGGALVSPQDAKKYISEKPVPLVLSEELWEALAGDPLPYRLANTLAETNPEFFESECYGVRVAQIEELLAAARRLGITQQNDLTTYVWAALKHPDLPADPRWQNAVRHAATGMVSLDAYFD